jgi:hypothetical protein
MYHETFRQMVKMLSHVNKWLDTTEAFAKSRQYDPNTFLNVRLAPDQFPLSRQIQTACDTAKLAASRLTGKEAPSHPDTEKTFDELRARIKAVTEYLEGFSAKDFEGAATRVISNPRWEGKTMTGADYFMEHAIPNFFFHVTTTYALLRANGVQLGKLDYLGKLSLR